MSLENQVARVSQGTKDTLKALINMMGGNITDELIDQYPAIASQLLPPTGITGNTVSVTAQEQLDAGNMIVIVQNGSGYDAYKATNESLPTTNFWLGISKDTVQSGSVADVTSIAYMDSTCNAVIEQNTNSEQKFWVGTDAEYQAIEVKDPNTMYLVTDDCGAVKGYITEAEYAALLETVNGKANAEHTHTKSEISDFAHGHEIADVNGLSSALSGKANSGNVYTKSESDTLLADKAPAGYGLGSNYGHALPNGDFDQATKNGWYYIASDHPTNGPDGISCVNAVLRVDRYVEIEQTLYLGTSGRQGCILRRYYHTGFSAWQPWEYVNPPMEPGKEYRTTERHNGKPVYVKRILLDALAIGTETASARTNIDGGSFTNVCETLVRHEMFVYPASGGAMFRLPFIQNDGKLKAIGSMNQSNVDIRDTWLYGSIYTFTDLSKYKAMVTCWYTKTTD